VSSSQLGGPWHALAAGRVREARNAFAAIVVQTPERAEAWLGLTLALWHDGDRFAALGAARKAHATDPNALDPQLVLGAIQRQIGDIAGAQATLESARRRHPDDAGLLRLLSDVYRRARRTADAMDAAERALALDGTSTQNVVCFGDALLATERLEGAEKAYRVALAVDPRDGRAAFGLGRVALVRGDWFGALAAFERAHAIAPQDADVRYNLALLHLRVGRYAEGYAAYPAIMDSTSDEARYYYHHEGVPLWHGEPK
jgi:tetratricopeptide (TPR) repeat protein